MGCITEMKGMLLHLHYRPHWPPQQWVNQTVVRCLFGGALKKGPARAVNRLLLSLLRPCCLSAHRPYNYFDKDAAKDLIETKLFRPDPETRQPVVVDYGMLSETDIQCIPSYPNITYDGFTDSSTAKGVKTS